MSFYKIIKTILLSFAFIFFLSSSSLAQVTDLERIVVIADKDQDKFIIDSDLLDKFKVDSNTKN